MTKRKVADVYKGWDRQLAQVEDLLLDPENIRLDVAHKDQDSIIVDLFTNEDTFAILESIIESGFFPDEVPVVIKKGNKFVILEGNRRVAALQAMIAPSRVPQYEERIRDVTKNIVTIEKIFIVVAPTRESALKFLANKHTRRSRRPWKTLRQAYFYYAQYEGGKNVEQLRREYPGVDIPRFIKMYEMHRIAKSLHYDNLEVTRKVADEKKFEISTLERIYNDLNVRKKLGLSFDESGHVILTSKKSAFEKAFTRIVGDIVNDRISSRTGIRTESERKLYIDQILPQSLSKATRAVLSQDFTPRVVPSTRPSITLDMRGIEFALHGYPGVGKMFDELRTINYRRYPIATYDLMRSFLECSLKAYLNFIGERPQQGRVRLQAVLNLYTQSASTPRNLAQKAQRISSSPNGYPYSVERMDMAQHNEEDFILAADVKAAWEEFKPIFRHILKPN